MPELTSQRLVEQIEWDIAERTNILRVAAGVTPALHILCDDLDHAPSLKYTGFKKNIGERLGMYVQVDFVRSESELVDRIQASNEDASMHGIIVQLPLRSRDQERTDAITALINPEKDVDGLAGASSDYESATARAGLMLFDESSRNYRKEMTVVNGLGRLVGKPALDIMQRESGLHVVGYDIESDRLDVIEGLNHARLIMTAIGSPGILKPDMFVDPLIPRVIVDAGAAEQGGKLRGDVSDELRQTGLAYGWEITPAVGGVGPLTVRLVLEHTVTAAEKSTY